MVDADGKPLGCLPAVALVAVLAREHREDLHRLAGILRESSNARHALEDPPLWRVSRRLPWLLVGGALVSIDAIATNAAVAAAITAQGADWLLAVKANQPTLRAEIEAAFAEAVDGLDAYATLDKGHGRIEERRMSVLPETDWLSGARRFPGELRLPGAACLLRAETRVESRGPTRTETRYFISSRALAAADAAAAAAVRGHCAIENRLHWVLDVTFADDQSRLRKGHGTRNMATVRHFALNLVRTAADMRSLKSRRKLAGWDPRYLNAILS